MHMKLGRNGKPMIQTTWQRIVWALKCKCKTIILYTLLHGLHGHVKENMRCVEEGPRITLVVLIGVR